MKDLKTRIKKLKSKKDKLNSPYLETPAKIVEVLPNHRYKLIMVDGSVMPHKQQYFTPEHFVWYGDEEEQPREPSRAVTDHAVPQALLDVALDEENEISSLTWIAEGEQEEPLLVENNNSTVISDSRYATRGKRGLQISDQEKSRSVGSQFALIGLDSLKRKKHHH